MRGTQKIIYTNNYEALPDLAFEEALVYLLIALKEVKAEISATVEQILDNFIKLLPVFMQK